MKTTVAKAYGLELNVIVWQPEASGDWRWWVGLHTWRGEVALQSGSRKTEAAARRAALKAAEDFACKLVESVNKALYEEGL